MASWLSRPISRILGRDSPVQRARPTAPAFAVTRVLTGQHRRGHVGAGRCLRGDVHTEITCDKNRSFPDLDSYGKERAYQEDGQGPVDEQGLRKATFTVSGTEV